MKILILSEPFVGLKDFFYGLTDHDSGQPAFYQVVEQLDKEGHEVVIITPTEYGETKHSDLWTNIHILAYREILGGDPLKLGERIRLGDLNLRFVLRVLQSVYFGLKLSKEIHFDLVVGHWEFATLVAFIVGRIRGIPNVSRLYGSNLIGRTGGTLNLKNILMNLNRVIPFITPASLYICTQDGTQADKAAEYFNIPREKFLHLLNGVERGETQICKPESNITNITFIGHLQSWKNPMRVLKLVPEVAQRHPTAYFHFIGSGYEEASMRKYIEEQNIGSRVCVHGRLPQTEKNDILAKTDIYVSFYSYTNLCNTLLEALYYGKAVLTIDEGDTGLVLKNNENAILLPGWDRDLALKKLLWLIDHPDKRAELGANALSWADKNLISWEERAKMEIQHYQDVIRSTYL